MASSKLLSAEEEEGWVIEQLAGSSTAEPTTAARSLKLWGHGLLSQSHTRESILLKYGECCLGRASCSSRNIGFCSCLLKTFSSTALILNGCTERIHSYQPSWLSALTTTVLKTTK